MYENITHSRDRPDRVLDDFVYTHPGGAIIGSKLIAEINMDVLDALPKWARDEINESGGTTHKAVREFIEEYGLSLYKRKMQEFVDNNSSIINREGNWYWLHSASRLTSIEEN